MYFFISCLDSRYVNHLVEKSDYGFVIEHKSMLI